MDITRTSYYISINFNFIFFKFNKNTLSRNKSAVVHLIGQYILSHTVWTHNQVNNPEEQKRPFCDVICQTSEALRNSGMHKKGNKTVGRSIT